MTYYFDATHIFTQDDGYAAIVGFTDDEFNPSKFVILQKALTPDYKDKQLGMDKMHIQVEDGSRSKYGAIKAINIVDGKIQILLAEEAIFSLQVEGDIEIGVDCSHPDFKEVLFHLKSMS